MAIQEHSVLKNVSTESDKLKVLCTVCVRDFFCSKTNNVKVDIESQPPEDSLTFDIVDTWIKAGIPIHTLKNPYLKNFLETNYRRKFPCTSTLYTTYSDKVYAQNYFTLKIYHF